MSDDDSKKPAPVKEEKVEKEEKKEEEKSPRIDVEEAPSQEEGSSIQTEEDVEREMALGEERAEEDANKSGLDEIKQEDGQLAQEDDEFVKAYKALDKERSTAIKSQKAFIKEEQITEKIRKILEEIAAIDDVSSRVPNHIAVTSGPDIQNEPLQNEIRADYGKIAGLLCYTHVKLELEKIKDGLQDVITKGKSKDVEGIYKGFLNFLEGNGGGASIVGEHVAVLSNNPFSPTFWQNLGPIALHEKNDRSSVVGELQNKSAGAILSLTKDFNARAMGAAFFQTKLPGPLGRIQIYSLKDLEDKMKEIQEERKKLAVKRAELDKRRKEIEKRIKEAELAKKFRGRFEKKGLKFTDAHQRGKALAQYVMKRAEETGKYPKGQMWAMKAADKFDLDKYVPPDRSKWVPDLDEEEKKRLGWRDYLRDPGAFFAALRGWFAMHLLGQRGEIEGGGVSGGGASVSSGAGVGGVTGTGLSAAEAAARANAAARARAMAARKAAGGGVGAKDGGKGGLGSLAGLVGKLKNLKTLGKLIAGVGSGGIGLLLGVLTDPKALKRAVMAGLGIYTFIQILLGQLIAALIPNLAVLACTVAGGVIGFLVGGGPLGAALGAGAGTLIGHTFFGGSSSLLSSGGLAGSGGLFGSGIGASGSLGMGLGLGATGASLITILTPIIGVGGALVLVASLSLLLASAPVDLSSKASFAVETKVEPRTVSGFDGTGTVELKYEYKISNTGKEDIEIKSVSTKSTWQKGYDSVEFSSKTGLFSGSIGKESSLDWKEVRVTIPAEVRFKDSEVVTVVTVMGKRRGDPDTAVESRTSLITVRIGSPVVVSTQPFGFPSQGTVLRFDIEDNHRGTFFNASGTRYWEAGGMDIVASGGTAVYSTVEGDVIYSSFDYGGAGYTADNCSLPWGYSLVDPFKYCGVGGAVIVKSTVGNYIVSYLHLRVSPLATGHIGKGSLVGQFYDQPLPTSSNPHLHYQILFNGDNVSFGSEANQPSAPASVLKVLPCVPTKNMRITSAGPGPFGCN
jgi:murein DD-endopeptidase MepM/ murein hydrolase activator NlpD